MTKSTAQLKRAVKAVREQHTCRRGEYVALQITHRVTAVFGGTGQRVDVSPYDSFHLAVATQVQQATGKALRVKLIGSQTDMAVAHVNGRVWTMKGDDKQALAKALAGSIETAGANDYPSSDALREALLAGKVAS